MTIQLLLLEFKSVDGPNKKKKIRNRRIMNHTKETIPNFLYSLSQIYTQIIIVQT